MEVTLKGHYEQLIAAANALRNQATDFELLNDRGYGGKNTRLTHKSTTLRRLAESIDDQIEAKFAQTRK